MIIGIVVLFFELLSFNIRMSNNNNIIFDLRLDDLVVLLYSIVFNRLFLII